MTALSIEGLKKFSNWPTYPQLYVKGDLIGGLDIVKVVGNVEWCALYVTVSLQEMNQSGELESMLPKCQSLDSRQVLAPVYWHLGILKILL